MSVQAHSAWQTSFRPSLRLMHRYNWVTAVQQMPGLPMRAPPTQGLPMRALPTRVLLMPGAMTAAILTLALQMEALPMAGQSTVGHPTRAPLTAETLTAGLSMEGLPMVVLQTAQSMVAHLTEAHQMPGLTTEACSMAAPSTVALKARWYSRSAVAARVPPTSRRSCGWRRACGC